MRNSFKTVQDFPDSFFCAVQFGFRRDFYHNGTDVLIADAPDGRFFRAEHGHIEVLRQNIKQPFRTCGQPVEIPVAHGEFNQFKERRIFVDASLVQLLGEHSGIVVPRDLLDRIVHRVVRLDDDFTTFGRTT